MHFYMREFFRSSADDDITRVVFENEEKKGMANVRPGDSYVITYKYGSSGANNELVGCGNCRFAAFTFHMAKYDVTFQVEKSIAHSVFRRVRLTFKLESGRLMVTPKDGFHCKENRIGPLIDECFFEGLLDDSMNIGTCPNWIKTIIAHCVNAMSGTPAVGDPLTALTPSRGELVEGFVVKSVKPYAARPKWTEVEPDREIPNSGVNEATNDFPGDPEKLKFTGEYNVDACGANCIIRNCTFREQRRHAILIRAPGGIIEGNTIDGVRGSGVHMVNEIGAFYEGPVPQNCIIRDNVIRNTRDVPIVVGSKRAKDPAAYAKQLRITGNRLKAGSTTRIEAFFVSDLKISDNKRSPDPTAPGESLSLSLENLVSETIATNSI